MSEIPSGDGGNREGLHQSHHLSYPNSTLTNRDSTAMNNSKSYYGDGNVLNSTFNTNINAAKNSAGVVNVAPGGSHDVDLTMLLESQSSLNHQQQIGDLALHSDFTKMDGGRITLDSDSGSNIQTHQSLVPGLTNQAIGSDFGGGGRDVNVDLEGFLQQNPTNPVSATHVNRTASSAPAPDSTTAAYSSTSWNDTPISSSNNHFRINADPTSSYNPESVAHQETAAEDKESSSAPMPVGGLTKNAQRARERRKSEKETRERLRILASHMSAAADFTAEIDVEHIQQLMYEEITSLEQGLGKNGQTPSRKAPARKAREARVRDKLIANHYMEVIQKAEGLGVSREDVADMVEAELRDVMKDYIVTSVDAGGVCTPRIRKQKRKRKSTTCFDLEMEDANMSIGKDFDNKMTMPVQSVGYNHSGGNPNAAILEDIDERYTVANLTQPAHAASLPQVTKQPMGTMKKTPKKAVKLEKKVVSKAKKPLANSAMDMSDSKMAINPLEGSITETVKPTGKRGRPPGSKNLTGRPSGQIGKPDIKPVKKPDGKLLEISPKSPKVQNVPTINQSKASSMTPKKQITPKLKVDQSTSKPSYPFGVQVNITTLPIYGISSVSNKLTYNSRKEKIIKELSSPIPLAHSMKNSAVHREYLKPYTPNLLTHMRGPDHLIASKLPGSFPASLSFRALSAYSIIRSLSITLRLSPFTPASFLRALSLPAQNRLLGSIHCALLRLLYAQHRLGGYRHRGDGMSNNKGIKKEEDGISDYLHRKDTLFSAATENLIYLDNNTWPLYYSDFTSVMLENFMNIRDSKEISVDGRSIVLRLLEDSGFARANGLDIYFKSHPSELEEEMKMKEKERADENWRSQQHYYQQQLASMGRTASLGGDASQPAPYGGGVYHHSIPPSHIAPNLFGGASYPMPGAYPHPGIHMNMPPPQSFPPSPYIHGPANNLVYKGVSIPPYYSPTNPIMQPPHHRSPASSVSSLPSTEASGKRKRDEMSSGYNALGKSPMSLGRGLLPTRASRAAKNEAAQILGENSSKKQPSKVKEKKRRGGRQKKRKNYKVGSSEDESDSETESEFDSDETEDDDDEDFVIRPSYRRRSRKSSASSIGSSKNSRLNSPAIKSAARNSLGPKTPVVKKLANTSSSHASGHAVATVKRGRGRPRKNAGVTPVYATQAETIQPKQRGRPKKKSREIGGAGSVKTSIVSIRPVDAKKEKSEKKAVDEVKSSNKIQLYPPSDIRTPVDELKKENDKLHVAKLPEKGRFAPCSLVTDVEMSPALQKEEKGKDQIAIDKNINTPNNSEITYSVALSNNDPAESQSSAVVPKETLKLAHTSITADAILSMSVSNNASSAFQKSAQTSRISLKDKLIDTVDSSSSMTASKVDFAPAKSADCLTSKAMENNVRKHETSDVEPSVAPISGISATQKSVKTLTAGEKEEKVSNASDVESSVESTENYKSVDSAKAGEKKGNKTSSGFDAKSPLVSSNKVATPATHKSLESSKSPLNEKLSSVSDAKLPLKAPKVGENKEDNISTGSDAKSPVVSSINVTSAFQASTGPLKPDVNKHDRILGALDHKLPMSASNSHSPAIKKSVETPRAGEKKEVTTSSDSDTKAPLEAPVSDIPTIQKSVEVTKATEKEEKMIIDSDTESSSGASNNVSLAVQKSVIAPKPAAKEAKSFSDHDTKSLVATSKSVTPTKQAVEASKPELKDDKTSSAPETKSTVEVSGNIPTTNSKSSNTKTGKPGKTNRAKQKNRGPPPLPGAVIKSANFNTKSTPISQPLHPVSQPQSYASTPHYQHPQYLSHLTQHFPGHSMAYSSSYYDNRIPEQFQSYGGAYRKSPNLTLENNFSPPVYGYKNRSNKYDVTARLVSEDVNDSLQNYLMLGPDENLPLGKKRKENSEHYSVSCKALYPSVLDSLKIKLENKCTDETILSEKCSLKAGLNFSRDETPVKAKSAENPSSPMDNAEGIEGDIENNVLKPGELRKADIPQLEPLKDLRKGVPYHLLPISTKLSMLEYLIDELLELDEVAAILLSRDRISSCYPYLYGELPTSEQLEHLTNVDECSVCGLEGALLCCDGCTASYHRKCINIPMNRELGEGKWLCHECKIVDPAKLGPLHGGIKSSLDWFTLTDTESYNSLCKKNESNSTDNSDLHMINDSMTGDHSTSSKDESNSNIPSSCGNQELLHSESKDDESLEFLLSVEFMIVHGYVFIRDARTGQPIDPNELLQKRKAPMRENGSTDLLINTSLLPLNPSQVFSLLSILGPNMCAQWPWCQIPFDPSAIWSEIDLKETPSDESSITSGNPAQPPADGVENKTILAETQSSKSLPDQRTLQLLKDHRTTYEHYFSSVELYNPTFYTNEYSKAPVHPIIKAHIGPHMFRLDQPLLEMENFAFRNSISIDFDGDRNLSLILRKERSLYDPLKPIREHLTRLEKSLFRSSLLHEFWGLRNISDDPNWWSRNVSICRSVNCLAKLLVCLIDNTHPRAFYDDWNSLPGTNNTSSDLDQRIFIDVSSDWSADSEMRGRRWERCSDSDILSLLVKEAGCLNGLFKNTTSMRDGSSSNRKRKKHSTGKLGPTQETSVKFLNRTDSDLDEFSHKKETTLGVMTTDSIGNSNDAPEVSTKELPVIKRSATAYNLFFQEKHREARDDVRAEGHGTKADDFTKEIAALWKSLGTRERAPYVKAAKQDKERYLAEKEALDKLKDSGDEEVDDSQSEDGVVGVRKVRRRGREDNSRRRSDRGKVKSALYNALIPIVSKTVSKTSTINPDDSEAQIRMKISRLEKIINESLEKEAHWPLAGRKLFVPEGSMSKPVVKWLGRNAGVKVAPHVTYVSKFEVGLPSVFQLWRKKTLTCNSFEQLVFQIRFLESYTNKATINSCETLTRRCSYNKSPPSNQKVIKCTNIDPATGMTEYFILNSTRNRGYWLSEQSIDLSALVNQRSRRIQSHQEKHRRRVEDFKRKEADQKRMQSLAEENARRQAEEQQRAEIQRKKMIQAEKARKAAQEKKLAAEQKKAAAKAERAAKKAMKEAAQQKKKAAQKAASCSKKGNMLIEFSIIKHQNEVKSLLAKCASKGLSSVPTEMLTPVRTKHMKGLREGNGFLKDAGTEYWSEDDLQNKLKCAEETGVQLYIREMQEAQEIHQQQSMKRPNKKKRISHKNHSPQKKSSLHSSGSTQLEHNLSDTPYFNTNSRPLSSTNRIHSNQTGHTNYYPEVQEGLGQNFASQQNAQLTSSPSLLHQLQQPQNYGSSQANVNTAMQSNLTSSQDQHSLFQNMYSNQIADIASNVNNVGEKTLFSSQVPYYQAGNQNSNQNQYLQPNSLGLNNSELEHQQDLSNFQSTSQVHLLNNNNYGNQQQFGNNSSSFPNNSNPVVSYNYSGNNGQTNNSTFHDLEPNPVSNLYNSGGVSALNNLSNHSSSNHQSNQCDDPSSYMQQYRY